MRLKLSAFRSLPHSKCKSQGTAPVCALTHHRSDMSQKMTRRERESVRARAGVQKTGCIQPVPSSDARLRLLLGVAGDDLVLNLVVRGLRENASGDELVLGGVGTAVDDALGVGVANAGEGLELVRCGGVNIERRSGGRRCCCRRLRRLGKIEERGNCEQEGGYKQLAAKNENRRNSL